MRESSPFFYSTAENRIKECEFYLLHSFILFLFVWLFYFARFKDFQENLNRKSTVYINTGKKITFSFKLEKMESGRQE